MNRWCCCCLASFLTSSARDMKTAKTSSSRRTEPERAALSGPLLPGSAAQLKSRKEFDMLMALFVILLLMWLLGMISSYTLGGFIHLLLLVALVVVLIRIIEGRRPL